MSTALAVHDLSREKVELIKQTVARGATDLELELFLHACQRTGLDPLMKQIYAIKRWSQVDGREVMTFQTGIDGLRLIADRTGQYAGSDEPVFMLGEDGFPDVASVTVYKLVGSLKCAFTHSVRWKEYVQLKKDGTPTSFWSKMPFGQLGKCAESGALRKSFPMELSGLYTHDEMAQADNAPQPTTASVAEKFPEQAKKIQEKLANPEPRHAEIVEPEPSQAHSSPTNYGELLTLSQSVREASDTLNAMEADEGVDLFTKTQLREQGKQRILALRKK